MIRRTDTSFRFLESRTSGTSVCPDQVQITITPGQNELAYALDNQGVHARGRLLSASAR